MFVYIYIYIYIYVYIMFIWVLFSITFKKNKMNIDLTNKIGVVAFYKNYNNIDI